MHFATDFTSLREVISYDFIRVYGKHLQKPYGGSSTSEKHTSDFYKEIGQKGGSSTARKFDKNFYREIGRKGGETAAKNRNNPVKSNNG